MGGGNCHEDVVLVTKVPPQAPQEHRAVPRFRVSARPEHSQHVRGVRPPGHPVAGHQEIRPGSPSLF